ncbi:diacylglycerol kinase [Betaproteobacteria bacterium GR16-43]|nr:diacylglycerol kinase [Betaproteobacteria bacterium GR16-43]
MTRRTETGPAAGPSIGIARIFKAFGYSLQGLAQTWRTEGAFRQEVLIALVLIPVACLVPVTPVERVLLIASWLLVMLVELINSALEAVVDRISEERHPLAGKAKDAGSAAVLMALVIAAVTWGLTLGPRLWAALFV